ncbi:hypothetical protein BJ741DRAFT_634393 [Chytriomyces cf. hyalinus JEL632]|nr:hypothetical protein BJ741DRAFT_634393 [Chytriomyces cf. hyalinus JEL632]
MVASLIGSAIMVVDSIRKGKHKTLSGRFPIYLGALNFIWSIGHSIDHMWMIVEHGLSPPDAVCKALSGLLSVFMFAEIFLIDAMALFMLATVYFKQQFTLGSYDWLLFAFVIGAPIGYLIIAASFDALGHDYYWCFLDVATSAGRVLGRNLRRCLCMRVCSGRQFPTDLQDPERACQRNEGNHRDGRFHNRRYKKAAHVPSVCHVFILWDCGEWNLCCCLPI